MTTNFHQTVALLATPFPRSRRNNEVHKQVADLILVPDFHRNNVRKLMAIYLEERMREKYWVAVFEALIVGNFKSAEQILSAVREEIWGSRLMHGKFQQVIVGFLRANVWGEDHSGFRDKAFDQKFPYFLGEMLRLQAEYYQEDDPAGGWLVGQFSEALSAYLHPDNRDYWRPTHGNYFERCSAILKEMRNVCIRLGAQNKFLNELSNRLIYNMGPQARMIMLWNWHQRNYDVDTAKQQSA